MRFIFLGAPGAGKGTQAEKIAEKFGIPKLSTGVMLRSEMEAGTELGKKITDIMNSGYLVSDDIMIELIESRLNQKDCERGFILDGFPRTIPQAEALDGIFSRLPSAKTHVVSLEVDEEILIKRLSGRFTCVDCGINYHKHFNKTEEEGVCDKCGSTDFNYREDDTEEAVKTRLDVYNKETAPLIDYYKKKGELDAINGMQSIDAIEKDIEALIADEQQEAL